MVDSKGEVKMYKVFVYGTLKRGGRFHKALQDSTFLGEARTKHLYGAYWNRYPVVTRKLSELQVHGEVYEVDDVVLKELDQIEGHPDLYIRDSVPVILDSGKEIEVLMYFLDLNEAELYRHKAYPAENGFFDVSN